MSTPEEILDYAHDVYDSKLTAGELQRWEQAFSGKSVAECRATMATFPKDPRSKITPAEFSKAWHRRNPTEKCTTCDNAGQIWDGERYTAYCACPTGAHMRELNERLACESEAARPVWVRALPEKARRYEAPEEPAVERCGGCGAPVDEHRPGDLAVCEKLDRGNRARHLEVVE